jgi:predicted exporter
VSTRPFDHATNWPTLHVQETSTALCRGSQAPLRLLLAVIVSALTTLEGFGTLALSVHRGIASLGLIALVGTPAQFLAALSTVPATLPI